MTNPMASTSVAAAAALVVFLIGLVFIKMMAQNRANSIDVRKIEDDTVRKAGALSAEIEGDFVVFLIGAGINNWWHLLTGKVAETGASMGAMLKELKSLPSEETGFLGGTGWLGNPTIQVQYWRSLEHLHAWARKPKSVHQTTWGRFNRYLAEAAQGMHDEGGVGIWHEAYLVKDGNYEAIYNLMPPLVANAT
ncbi:hypothetical protein WJX73_005129 [Symbiochloris irregularis]|uniref:DUF4188 domain-containing protein n=1 Tax=Symbiochloris irregularis TaxID=706552 RepID=A0AAW1PTN3_9CHLO